MCGIAGIVGPAGPLSETLISTMRDTLRHRGPDDAGTWLSPDGRAGLGHRRLSILDLSPRGHQPMIDPAGRAAIVYNGEVYNFRPLREQLTARGVRFSSDTDTEVILQAYLAWGDTFVEKLEGMFALAIWDMRHSRLILVRDRLGIKPLMWSRLPGGGLAFGSEIRALLACSEIDRSLSPEAAWDFFAAGYIPAPRTIYRDIAKLPPATMLTWQDGQLQQRVYWQPSFASLGDSPETARRTVLDRIDQAVAEYLIADVETGAYLSGGVDSSVVTARAAEVYAGHLQSRLGGSQLHTFTIGFDVSEHSEAHFARQAAATFGTEHTELTVTRQMAHRHDTTILELFDEPFAASSTIPMTFLAELARQKVTVALCGEGGDEIFGGYGWYSSFLRFRRPSFWATAPGRAVRQVFERLRGRAKTAWRLPAIEDDVELYAQLMGAVDGPDRRRIFSGDILSALAERDPAEPFRPWWREDLPPMTRMQNVDLHTFLPELNLTRADRTSMRVGLELRVPLLDHRLAEYVLGLTEQVRTPNGLRKGLFKQAVAGRISPAIRGRKKKGFSSPLRQWFSSDDLLGVLRDLRADKPDLARTWLSVDIDTLCREVRGSRAYKLWVFLRWLHTVAP